MTRLASRKRSTIPEQGGAVDQLSATAYHEAGHAVISYARGFGCYSVSIVPDDVSLGRFQLKPFDEAIRPDCDLDARTERLTCRLVVVTMAGFAAELRITGQENWGGAANDKQRAVSRCANLRGEPDDVAKPFFDLLDQAKVEVSRTRRWAAIRRLTAELLVSHEIPGDETERIIGQILRR